jgi:hypothetical protein
MIVLTEVDPVVARRVFETLEKSFAFYQRPESELLCQNVNEFCAEIYPELRALLYRTRILDEWDDHFVSQEGSDELLCFDGGTHGQLAPQGSANLIVDRHDLRLVFLLVEALASYFHQQGHWETQQEVNEFAELIRPRLADACNRIQATWFAT